MSSSIVAAVRSQEFDPGAGQKAALCPEPVAMGLAVGEQRAPTRAVQYDEAGAEHPCSPEAGVMAKKGFSHNSQ